MNSRSKILLLLTGVLAASGLLYFISLLLHFPFLLVLLLIPVAVYFICVKLGKGAVDEAPSRNQYLDNLVLLAGLFFISYKGVWFGEKWGAWDAWAQWDMHARFLLRPADWTMMMDPSFAVTHNDYPLMLPGIVACYSKIFQENILLVSFAVSLLISLLVAGLIYTEIAARNILAGVLALAAFVCSDFFVSRGVMQYADMLMALFFTATIVGLYHYELTANNRYLAMAGFFMACAVWTKNEGAVFFLCTGLLYAKDFLRKKNIAIVLASMSLPLAVWLVFKAFYSPPSDILHQQNEISWAQRFAEKDRYLLILDSFWRNLKEHCPELLIAAGISMICMVLSRKWWNRKWAVLILTMLCCQASYIVSPYGLEWHLATSQDRLILQVFPAMVYVSGMTFATRLSSMRALF